MGGRVALREHPDKLMSASTAMELLLGHMAEGRLVMLPWAAISQGPGLRVEAKEKRPAEWPPKIIKKSSGSKSGKWHIILSYCGAPLPEKDS